MKFHLSTEVRFDFEYLIYILQLRTMVEKEETSCLAILAVNVFELYSFRID